MSIEAQLARNEVLFRAINDRIRAVAARLAMEPGDDVEFLCECADETCTERVRLTLDQYAYVRALPTRFVIVGAPLEGALRAASTVPARVAGRRGLGTIVRGARADAVILDDRLEIERVLLAGADALG